MTAEQTGTNTVLVTWTPPPAPPAAGYKVQLSGDRTTSANAIMSSSTIQLSVNNQFGVYSIRVISLSQHYSEASAPVQITVRGI